NTARPDRRFDSGAGGRARDQARARRGSRALDRLVRLRLRRRGQIRSRDAALGLVVVAEDAHQALAFERFLADQFVRQAIELVAMLDDDLLRPLPVGVDEPADLLVDRLGDAVAVIALLAELAAEEDHLLL